MRAAVKQTCRRLGYHATFVCRPRLPNVMSSGWHLHRSLILRKSGESAFAPSRDEDALSPLDASYAAGLLKHAGGVLPACHADRQRLQALSPLFASAEPHPVWTQLPRHNAARCQRRQQRRVTYRGRQSLSLCDEPDLEGSGRRRERVSPSDMTSAPYETEGPRLPRHLLAAVDAFEASDFYRRALGAAFVDYLCTIKPAELGRFFQDATRRDP